MKFWDSSAIIPLCIDEDPETTAAIRVMFDNDPAIVAWWGSVIECASAFARLERESRLTLEEHQAAVRNLMDLRSAWREVLPTDRVQAGAVRAVRVHGLRAGDALQLAAGLEWALPANRAHFVTLDDRLRAAAVKEGFEASV